MHPDLGHTSPFPIQFQRAPLLLLFLVACHTQSPESRKITEVGERTWNSHYGNLCRKWLIDNDIVDKDYNTTDRGKAWLKAMYDLPLPEATWAVPK